MISSLNIFSTAENLTGYQRLTDSYRPNSPEASSAVSGPEDPDRQAGDSRQLSEEEKQQVQQLKQRDQEVRAHERAHMAAGADLVQGGASFTFQRGPDGGMYAVGGEVKVDTSAERDPDQTIRKMQQVKRAALAPTDPSGADRAVAAQASQIEARARQEKSKDDGVGLDTGAPDDQGAHQVSATIPAVPGRRPYSAEAVGQSLNIAV